MLIRQQTMTYERSTETQLENRPFRATGSVLKQRSIGHEPILPREVYLIRGSTKDARSNRRYSDLTPQTFL